MTGAWRDVMLSKHVSRLDLWKYYSLYGGMWNLFCRVGHYPRILSSHGDGYYRSTEVEECDIDMNLDTVHYNRHFGVFGDGTRLAMPKTNCAPDSSSLKPGSGATEGVLD